MCSGVNDLECDRTGYLEACDENVSPVYSILLKVIYF